MLTRLRVLFRRFVRQHRHVDGPGFDLGSPARPLGRVDRVNLTGDTLTLSGQCTAHSLTLTSTEGRATGLPSPDFQVSLPLGDGTLRVVIDTADGPQETRLSPIAPRRLRAENRRVAKDFALAAAQALPLALRYVATKDLRHHRAIKALFGFAPPGVPSLDAAFFSPPAATQDDPRPDALTIILPVYNAFDLLPEVLDRLDRHTDVPAHLVIVEDASTDPDLRPWLLDWAADRNADQPGRVTLLLHDTNQGFIRSVNEGFAIALDRDAPVVLLNADALVPEGWAARLLAPILRDPTVASVTPMSNDAEIFSVPVLCQRLDLRPDEAEALDRQARAFGTRSTPEIEAPTGVGFCMAISAEWLARQPAFDTGFGRGYGEEVDWCQKIRAGGGRHVAAPGLFVEHKGGASFGSSEKTALVAENSREISRRYPGYDADVQAFGTTDPLVSVRIALAAGWAGLRAGETAVTPVYLAHSLGGGAEADLTRRLARDRAAGTPPIVLRVGGPARWQIEVVSDAGRCIAATDDISLVEAVLANVPHRRFVYSCGVGDPDPAALPGVLLSLRRPGDRIQMLIHDYLPLSPSYALLDADGVYRPPLDPARADAAHEVLRPEGTRLDLAGWQQEWGKLVQAADDIEVFSPDSRRQLLAVYPEAAPAIHLRPHTLPTEVPTVPAPKGARRLIGVLGTMGQLKGAAVVVGLGRKLERTGQTGTGLVVIGDVALSQALPGSVRVHGAYTVDQLPDLVARYGITDWLIPSIWPETFSFTTHEALATGLPTHAFAIGAQGDAVAEAPNGHPIPYDPDADVADAVWTALGIGPHAGSA